MRQRLDQRGEEETEGGRTSTSLQTRLTDTEAALDRERLKVKQLEGELVTRSLVKEGMDRNAEKVSFINSTPSLHMNALPSVYCRNKNSTRGCPELSS